VKVKSEEEEEDDEQDEPPSVEFKNAEESDVSRFSDSEEDS